MRTKSVAVECRFADLTRPPIVEACPKPIGEPSAMRQHPSRRPLWITQIFVDIDWALLVNAVREKHPEHTTVDLHMAIRVHGYTVGTVTFPHHGHIECRFPVETIDRENISMTLFCTSAGAFNEHIHTSLATLLRKWREKRVRLHFAGYQAGPGRAVMGPSGHHNSIHHTNEENPVASAFSAMKYYGIQLLTNPETQEVYDAAGKGPLGRYNAKHGVVVSSLE